MRLFISIATLGLCICALVACSPQDGSAPASGSTASGSSNSARTENGNANGNMAAQTTKQTPAPDAPQAGETRRISIEESQAAATGGKALIVDVRDENTYKTSHIKGAKSIPLSQFEQRAGELPKDKLIITYCA